MPQPPVTAYRICRVTDHSTVTRTEDLVVTEEPLEIRVGYTIAGERVLRELAVTMRTPGYDLELALGFLFTEGIIRKMSEIRSIRLCEEANAVGRGGNVVKVELDDSVVINPDTFQRSSFINSSCGICSKVSFDVSAIPAVEDYVKQSWQVSAGTLLRLASKLNIEQRIFKATGGIHAAVLFDKNAELIVLREDIGRHNALDKLIGHGCAEGMLPFKERILLLSGRIGFELVQKAAMAGVKIICAMGAPSSLAVECAIKYCITLVGFLKADGFNIYCGEDLIKEGAE